MVAYYHDSNVILYEPTKNRCARTIVTAWEKLNKKFLVVGARVETYILDNECSKDLKEAFAKSEVTYQLATSHLHCALKV